MSELDPTVTTPLAFPGEQLREARERQGISIDQVCNQLHLHAATVEAFEASDVARLKDPVFVRGYIRAYASYLKLDPKPFVDAYNQASGQKTASSEVKSIGSVSMVPGRRHGHPVLKIGSWLFILALIAVFVWWWQAQYGFDDSVGLSNLDEPVSVETTDGNTLVLPPLAEPDAVLPAEENIETMAGQALTGTDAVEAEVVESVEASSSAGEAEATQVQDEQSSMPVDKSVSPESSAMESESGAEPVAPVATEGLVIALADDCWLQVKASNGRTLYSGVAKAGTTLELDGDEPLAVVVGRVSAVQSFTYAGQSIDLSSRAREGVARLSLPL